MRFTVTRGVTRPVWEPDEQGHGAVRHRARHRARRSASTSATQSAGGGSDGNFTGAMGIPTLDGLGVQGAGAHTLEEHIVIDSLVPRGRLIAGLLATLAVKSAGSITPPGQRSRSTLRRAA